MTYLNTTIRTLIIGTILCFPVFATTTIDRIDVTPQQAVITVKTDQTPSTCVIHASFGTSLSTDIADIADNGTTTARIGTIIEGKRVKFEIGKRRGDWSLAGSNQYTVGVTCGSDSQVTKTFRTKPVPWGNLAPCDIPFNASKPWNADWPNLDFDPTHYSKMYADPCTGAEYYINNTIGFASAYYGPASSSRLFTADDLDNAGTWTNLANIGTTGCTPGSTCVHATGGPSDKLFVPIANLPYVGYSSASIATYNSNPDSANIKHDDDYMLDVFCGNSSQGETLTIQLSVDHGVHVVGNPQTVTCPTGSFTKVTTVPSSVPNPPFKGWGYVPMQNQRSSVSGTASVAGTIVTANSGVFYTHGEMGPFIRIAGAEHQIVSVDSPTQITIADDMGTIASANWATCGTGFVVTKSGTGGLDLALGLNWAASRGEGWGQDANWPWTNWVPVTVAYEADGITPMPATNGYLAYTSGGDLGAVYLWIPKNADGTVRNEKRLLSSMQVGKSQSNVHLNGDTANASITLTANDAPGSAWTGDSDSLLVTQVVGARLWKMKYYTLDDTRLLTGTSAPCSHFPAYSPALDTVNFKHGTYFAIEGTPNPPVDCFDYYDMTPGGYNNMILNAYTPNPPQMGKPTWLSGSYIQNTLGNKVLINMQAGQNNLSLIGVIDVSGTSPVVTKVWDSWSGSGQSAGVKFPSLFRWGGIHSCSGMSTKYAFCANNNINGTSASIPLGGIWKMPVVGVNRADYGAPENWDTNTTISAYSSGDRYTCPTVGVTPEQSIVAGTKRCVEIKVSTPPCSTSPYTGTDKFGGLNEVQAFPCSTPDGNGGTLGIANASRSKLQDLRAGDCLVDINNDRNELLCLVTDPQYVAVNDIRLWLSRANYQLWQGIPFNDSNENDTGSLSSHSNGWTARMQPSYATNGSGQGQGVLVPLDGSDELFQYGLDQGCHASTSPVGTDGHIAFMVDGCGSFKGAPDIDAAVDGAHTAPTFGKADNFQNMSFGYGNIPQSYPALGDTTVQPLAIGSDYHSFLTSNGNAPNDGHTSEDVLWNTNPVLVDGTTHTYTITAKPITPGTGVYKRQPYIGTAGRYVLKDISGTGPYTGDMPDDSFCIALSAGECYPTSTAGQTFVSVPGMDTSGKFYESNFSYPAPGVFAALPQLGTAQIYRIDGQTGFPIHQILGYNMVPATTHTYSNCRFEAGEFLWCIAQFANNKFTTELIYHLHPQEGFDNIDHSKFIPTTISVKGVPWATYVRARFGYLENGTNPANNAYRCTNYGHDCSTDPPASSGEWYSFVTSWDVGTRTACTAGAQCPVTLNLISGRVAYYVIDRLAADGSVISTSAPEVMVTP